MPSHKDRDGVEVGWADLTILDFLVSYTGSADFYLEQESPFIASTEWWNVLISGREVGAPTNLLGVVPISDGQAEFAYGDLADQSQLVIRTDSHYPSTFTEIEWRGRLSYRSRRLTKGG